MIVINGQIIEEQVSDIPALLAKLEREAAEGYCQL